MVSSRLTSKQNDNGLIINLAPTGGVAGKAQTPYIPITHNEIVEDVAECLELGIHMVHLHVRDEEGRHSADPERYGRLIESVRKLPGGRDLIICVSTSGRYDPSYQSRSRVLDLDGDMKPDMASLTLSSLNFMSSASINEPETIKSLAAKMLEKGIKPELEIFDLGMLNIAHVLLEEGLIVSPIYTNILLGNIAGSQASLSGISAMLLSIPDDWVVSLAGLGRSQLTANIMGITYAEGVRVGLEDNLWLDKDNHVLAKNADLVKRVQRIALECQRSIETKTLVRKRLLDAEIG
ncbi:MAG: 3-keto-5-aminohexanoate cleavage protein [Methylophaga sp.]|nr:3-keto-5-aminohexanoate cleavage protein [Methylophaga sp.]